MNIYYSILLIFILILLFGKERKEHFYTLFQPYHVKDKIKLPNYSLYTQKYKFTPLTIGIATRNNYAFINSFIQKLMTFILSRAYIAELEIKNLKYDYQIAQSVSHKNLDIGIISEPVLAKISTQDYEYMDGIPSIDPDNIQFLTNISKNYIYIITLIKNDISQLSDLFDKTIAVEPDKTTGRICADDLLTFLTRTKKATFNIKQGHIHDNIRKMYSGSVDAIIFSDYDHSNLIREMVLTGITDQYKKIRIIPITGFDHKEFETEYFYYYKSTLDLNKLPQGYLPVYSDHNKFTPFNPDLDTYTFNMMMVCNPKVERKVAYNIVYNIYRNPRILKMIGHNRVEFSTTYLPINTHLGANEFYQKYGYSTTYNNPNCKYFVGKRECNAKVIREFSGFM